MKGSSVRIVVIVAAAFSCAAQLPIVSASRPAANGDPGPREIRIVARDMAFFVDGDDAANPTLRLKAGEQVRLVLRNEDAGLTHDFAIASWKIATKTLTEKGAETAVVFRVPGDRGTTPYQCTPHAQMMRGSIQVE
jgi:plastocyanin